MFLINGIFADGRTIEGISKYYHVLVCIIINIIVFYIFYVWSNNNKLCFYKIYKILSFNIKRRIKTIKSNFMDKSKEINAL